MCHNSSIGGFHASWQFATIAVEDYLRFCHVQIEMLSSLLILMHAESGQWTWDPVQLRVLVKPRPEFKISGIVKRIVNASSGTLPQRPSPKSRLLLDEPLKMPVFSGVILPSLETGSAESTQTITTENLALVIHAGREQSGNPFHLGERGKNISYDLKRPWIEFVIAV